MELVVADIGGTHARFALAEVAGDAAVSLASETTLNSGDFASLEAAWASFAGGLGRPLPRAACIALAGPVEGEVLKFTNSPWTLHVSRLKRELGLDRLTIVNDFAAIAHAVAILDATRFRHLCGPEGPLPAEGVVSVVGPGTGLGVAQLVRWKDDYHVVSTEGGHTNFAPSDSFEDAMLARLRQSYAHVSAERLVSGPGLLHIYASIAEFEGRPALITDDKTLWEAALTGEDSLAVAALARFCLCLGSCAGDIALAQGANAVVIAGGLGLRLADVLPRTGFCTRFAAKGRFSDRMASLPVKVITHPQPGLIGAAAAFAQQQNS